MWPGLLESSLAGKEGWWRPRTYNLLSEHCLVADISETPSSNCIVEKCRIFVERQRPDESGKRFNEHPDLQVFAMLQKLVEELFQANMHWSGYGAV